jgi:hypothetical protein
MSKDNPRKLQKRHASIASSLNFLGSLILVVGVVGSFVCVVAGLGSDTDSGEDGGRPGARRLPDVPALQHH